MKVSNTLNTINYMKPTKTTSRRSSTSGDDEDCSCSCDCNYNLTEVNRDLFIENYLTGRGATKLRSSSLTPVDDESRDKNNYRRKSLMEKKCDDHLQISRNHLFGDKADRMDRAVTRHKINNCRHNNEYADFYETDDEKSVSCDYIETSVPTLKKINNNFREFVDAELVFQFNCLRFHLHFNGN